MVNSTFRYFVQNNISICNGLLTTHYSLLTRKITYANNKIHHKTNTTNHTTAYNRVIDKLFYHSLVACRSVGRIEVKPICFKRNFAKRNGKIGLG